MSSICDHPLVQDKEICKANLDDAKALATSKGLPDALASALILQCAPCMMEFGHIKGEDGMSMCDKANDISSLTANLPEEAKARVPATCMGLVAMMQ